MLGLCHVRHCYRCEAQTTQLTNHYAMKLIEDGQGGYKLLQEARYAKHA